MDNPQLTVALITDVFFGIDGPERLAAALTNARSRGCDLAALPELPLDRWAPATREVRDEDAEDADGPRHRRFAEAAATAGIAVLGGAIIRDPGSGRRHNTALLFDSTGRLLGRYSKTHLPQEEGFWEASHYEPGDEPPRVLHGLDLRVGVQICSDCNRPFGCHLLRTAGAEVIFAPRATPEASYERWKLVLRANAVTSGTYVISINRPDHEAGTDIGGPSLAIAPDGGVLVESRDQLATVTVTRSSVEAARENYPGYLAERSGLYAKGWSELGGVTIENTGV